MRLLDEMIGRVGLINEVFSPSLNRSFCPDDLVTLVAKSKNLKWLGFNINEIVAGATSLNENDCALATFGELLERMAGARPNFERLRYCSYSNLVSEGNNALNPKSIKYYDQNQFLQKKLPFDRFEEDSETFWINGFDYYSNQNIWIPDFLTYWTYTDNDIPTRFHLPNSTGLSAGKTLSDAILHGIFENIERHAFSVFWYNQNNDVRTTYDQETILLAFDDLEIQKLFRTTNIQIKVFDLGDISPVETVVVFFFFKYKNRAHYSIGSASRFSKREAIVKAAYEAYQMIHVSTKKITNNDSGNPEFEKFDCTSFEKHFDFYNKFPGLWDTIPVFKDAMRMTGTEKKIKQIDNKIKSVREFSEDLTGPIYIVDLSDHIDLYTLPYQIVRVVSPKYALLSGNAKVPFLGNLNVPFEKLYLEYPHCLG